MYQNTSQLIIPYNYCTFRGMNIHSPLIYGAHQGFWRVLRKFPSNHFPCVQQDFTGESRHLHDWCFQTALLWAKLFFYDWKLTAEIGLFHKIFQSYPFSAQSHSHFPSIFPAISAPAPAIPSAMVIPAAADSFHYVSGADGTRRPRLVTFRWAPMKKLHRLVN